MNFLVSINALTNSVHDKVDGVTKNNPAHTEKPYSMNAIKRSRSSFGVKYLFCIAVN